MYAQTAQNRQAQEDAQRQRFFEYMQNFQFKNDMKQKQFRNYLAGKDIQSLGQLDEARYLKAQQEQMINNRKKEDEKAMKYNIAQLDNKNYLFKQMEDKRAQKNMERMQDKAFADVLARQIQEG